MEQSDANALAQAASNLRRTKITEGKPFPLGATWDGLGVNFALFSANATKVELCLFDGIAHARQEYFEGSPVVKFAVDPDRTAALFNDPIDR